MSPLVEISPGQDSMMVKEPLPGVPANHRIDSFKAYTKILQKDTAVVRNDSIPEAQTLSAADTATICYRNSISDVTFYDSTNLLTRIYYSHQDKFPILFTSRNREIQDKAKAVLEQHLKAGNERPVIPLHDDWIILVIFVSAVLFGLIRRSSLELIHSVERFFLFRGIGEPVSRDTGSLLNWDSTLKNLLSFLSLGLFGYAAAAWYDVLPATLPGVVSWLILVVIIIAAVTLRHISCLLTGYISGQRDVFLEYIMSMYQFYRFCAIFIFVVTILIVYTTILPAKVYFTAGIFVIGLLYLIRVMRLLLIFINRGISLFYFILYLCALEILPVVISVKYVSGFII
jgi:hypothetical protein